MRMLPFFNVFSSDQSILHHIILSGDEKERPLNEEISIEAYAASRNMSTSWFSRCFRTIVGESPMRYILLLRIRNAQVLLETTDGTVSEIARIVGYENSMYFSRLFRKEKGVSPLKYRKAFQAGLRDPNPDPASGT